MRDQNEFMKQMLDLVDFAKTKESRITKKEVAEFCHEWQLSEAQLKLVYDFLDEHNIEVSGYSRRQMDSGEDGGDRVVSEGRDTSLNTEDSKYLSVYHRELRELREVPQEERNALYERLLAGDESAVNPVIETHLKRVVTLAGKYKNRGVPLEDLIQEGNLALIMTADMLCGSSVSDVRKELDRAVRARMIELADSQLESKGLENTIVSKTNLIHEASKVFAEEWGRLATISELAEYTKMTEEEIQTYVELSLEEIKVGRPGERL